MWTSAQAIMLAAASFIVGALSLAAYYDWQCGRRMAARAQRAYERDQLRHGENENVHSP